MLDLALPRHPEPARARARALGDLCQFSCIDAGLKLVADGVAAACALEAARPPTVVRTNAS